MEYIPRCIFCNSILKEEKEYIKYESGADLVLICDNEISDFETYDYMYLGISAFPHYLPHYVEMIHVTDNSSFLIHNYEFTIKNCNISLPYNNKYYEIYFSEASSIRRSDLNIPIIENEISSNDDFIKFYDRILKLELLI